MADLDDSSNEASAADQKPAGYGKRALGAIIDFLIVAVVQVVPNVVFFIGLVAAGNASDKGEPTTTAAGMMMILGVVAGLAALVWTIWLFGYRQGVTGTTPGKRAAGTRLTRIGTGEAPGGSIGVGRILVPWLVASATAGVYVIIDYLWPLWDDHKQRVSDKLFKTQVVLDDRPATPTQYNPIG
ncbi:MAG: RDD family protein [Actinomycetota bacterium]|nr:RDD family protein [Actinomycetota bacterium]